MPSGIDNCRMNPRSQALQVLCERDPNLKAQQARALFASLDLGAVDPEAAFAPDAELPGRPDLPRLVPPKEVPSRSPFTTEGRAALLHAITHIEFNAINLALDAVWRFSGMPVEFYRDWLQVASEEALHFTLLRAHLQALGADYGSFDAHDGLWLMTERTAHDITARMALVPRTLEARGLDATPVIQAKLLKVGTPRARDAIRILDTILAEEVGHVAIGNRWYHWLCQRNGLDPDVYQPQVAAQHKAPRLKPPFNLAARRLAGFGESELRALADISTSNTA